MVKLACVWWEEGISVYVVMAEVTCAEHRDHANSWSWCDVARLCKEPGEGGQVVWVVSCGWQCSVVWLVLVPVLMSFLVAVLSRWCFLAMVSPSSCPGLISCWWCGSLAGGLCWCLSVGNKLWDCGIGSESLVVGDGLDEVRQVELGEDTVCQL